QHQQHQQQHQHQRQHSRHQQISSPGSIKALNNGDASSVSPPPIDQAMLSFHNNSCAFLETEEENNNGKHDEKKHLQTQIHTTSDSVSQMPQKIMSPLSQQEMQTDARLSQEECSSSENSKHHSTRRHHAIPTKLDSQLRIKSANRNSVSVGTNTTSPTPPQHMSDID
ncbi:hypothetical protein RFI_17501, partial [Reticulomyxa filosa]